MGCTATFPPEHKPECVQKNTQPRAPNTCLEPDKEHTLSSPGQLQIPPSIQKWFPPEHAHANIRSLFKFHNEISCGTTCSIHHIEYDSKPCALKQIPKHDASARMLFETEAQVLSKIHHKGIIALMDLFYDENYYYLVLQKADFDLQYVMRKQVHLSERKTRNIIYSLLQTIEYMHRKRVVHRDIKPENIVFMADDTDQSLLIDFGDAELVRNDGIYVELVGTPPYMSPERLEEHKGWELKKSDIWAVGAMAYEMYCGERCFTGNTQKQVFGKILSNEWSWPNGMVVSDAFKDFIEECLAFNAKDRLTATEALNHPWFEGMNKDMENEHCIETVHTLGVQENKRECEQKQCNAETEIKPFI
eukprot:871147_1